MAQLTIHPVTLFNTVLAFVIIAGISFTIYIAWSVQDSDEQEITTFELCVEATGGAVTMSYPAQCSINGKTFTDHPITN